jgi:hypothetical protein
MKTIDQINTNIAHINDGGFYFQVLTQDGLDWDEQATKAEYDLYLSQKQSEIKLMEKVVEPEIVEEPVVEIPIEEPVEVPIVEPIVELVVEEIVEPEIKPVVEKKKSNWDKFTEFFTV